jgi:hypothetical protein
MMFAVTTFVRPKLQSPLQREVGRWPADSVVLQIDKSSITRQSRELIAILAFAAPHS